MRAATFPVLCFVALVATGQAIGFVDFTRVILQFPYTPKVNDTETAYSVLAIGLGCAALAIYLGIVPRHFQRGRRGIDEDEDQEENFWHMLSYVDNDDGCLTMFACLLMKNNTAHKNSALQGDFRRLEATRTALADAPRPPNWTAAAWKMCPTFEARNWLPARCLTAY